MNSLPAGPPDPHPRGAPPVTLPRCEPAPGRAKSPQRPAVAPHKGSRSDRAAGRTVTLCISCSVASRHRLRCHRQGCRPRRWARRSTRHGRGGPRLAGQDGDRQFRWPGTLTGHRTDDAASLPCGDHRAGPPHRTTGRPGHGQSPAPVPVVGSAGTCRSAASFSSLVQRPRPDTGPSGARRGCEGGGELSGGGKVPACWPRTSRSCARAAPTWLRA